MLLERLRHTTQRPSEALTTSEYHDITNIERDCRHQKGSSRHERPQNRDHGIVELNKPITATDSVNLSQNHHRCLTQPCASARASHDETTNSRVPVLLSGSCVPISVPFGCDKLGQTRLCDCHFPWRQALMFHLEENTMPCSSSLQSMIVDYRYASHVGFSIPPTRTESRLQRLSTV